MTLEFSESGAPLAGYENESRPNQDCNDKSCSRKSRCAVFSNGLGAGRLEPGGDRQ